MPCDAGIRAGFGNTRSVLVDYEAGEQGMVFYKYRSERVCVVSEVVCSGEGFVCAMDLGTPELGWSAE